MSPAATLRAAATKLRETASKALQMRRPIDGFPGYSVSPVGEIWSTRRGAPRRLAVETDHRGYLLAYLMRDGRKTKVRVHTAVAGAYLGPRPDGLEIRHLDGNKTNNWYPNLRYGTAAENTADRLRHKTVPWGMDNGYASISNETVQEIRELGGKGMSSRQIAAKVGHSRAHVKRILNGQARVEPTAPERPQDESAALWAALMHPQVAEPLAAWLDGVAKDIDGHDPDGGCECTESDSYHRAMDFAAAILGRQS